MKVAVGPKGEPARSHLTRNFFDWLCHGYLMVGPPPFKVEMESPRAQGINKTELWGAQRLVTPHSPNFEGGHQDNNDPGHC